MKYRHIPYHIKRKVILTIALAILAFFYLFKNYSVPIRAISAALFIVLFYIVDHAFDIRFKHRHYFFILAFAFFGFLLSPLYYLYPSYDKIQHLLLPIMYSSIIFHTLHSFNIKLKWKLIFVFFIVIGTNGLFEVGEYAIDQFTDFKLQGVYLRDEAGLEKYQILQEKIDDTMIDMMLGTIGALAYALSMAIFFRKKYFSSRQYIKGH